MKEYERQAGEGLANNGKTENAKVTEAWKEESFRKAIDGKNPTNNDEAILDKIAKTTSELDKDNALTKLKEANIQLAIYGDGPDRQLFQQQAKKLKGVQFFGHQSDILEKVAGAHVYILPSYQEGFSIALLEATMLGKTIIATDIDSNPEIIDHEVSGLLVPPHSPDKLAAAMVKLYIHPELRQKYAKNARKKYEEEFNLYNKVKNEILPLYR
jgi:glycosyltransferase involved in cell wall biosynthesis